MVFLLYSSIGWILSTVSIAIQKKKFIDIGVLYGPYCPSYGIAAVGFTIFLTDLRQHLFFLFLGGMILSSLVAFMTGVLLEHIFHRKWWDYSKKKFHFAGHVNLPYSVIWGFCSVLCVLFLNPLFTRMIDFFPVTVGEIILFFIYGIIAIDIVATGSGIVAVHFHIRKLAIVTDVSKNLQKTTDFMGKGLTAWVQAHLEKSYPALNAKELILARQEREKKIEEEKKKADMFAIGCSFYKLAWLFFLGSFLGDITETIFCLLKDGILMSRSSVVYGPFSIVWGFGCVLLTLILYQYRNYNDRFIFLFGTVVGGAYEYGCSVLSELLFGTVFWDYSEIPFNLGGRINLLYCFFWGIAAVLWLKILYPILSNFIEKIPNKIGTVLTWIFLVFMVINIAMSALALARYVERQTTPKGDTSFVASFFDTHFPDERMERVYPNAMLVQK